MSLFTLLKIFLVKKMKCKLSLKRNELYLKLKNHCIIFQIMEDINYIRLVYLSQYLHNQIKD